jgi:poly-gamma-glutamate synthesis protein (capsule biosynthesis protein)
VTLAAPASRWTLAAVGDVMLERAPAENPACERLRAADVAFANLEVPLADPGHPADKLITLLAPPSVATALPQMGLRVVSFANNHSLDFGIPALLQTIGVVEAAGVKVIGAGADLAAALRPAVTEHHGVRVAWLALASTLPPGSAATPERPGIAPLRVRVRFEVDVSITDEQPGTSPYVATEVIGDDLVQAATAVRDARAIADVVIVSLHWGVPPGWAAPFQGLLAEYQQPLARALIDAGADVILGHHPHTLHGVERYKSRPIFYSLGNFIFHAMAVGRRFTIGRPSPPFRLDAVRVPELDESAVFVLEFEGARCQRITIHPVVADAAGECRPASAAQASAILERMQAMCAALGVAMRIDGHTGVIEITT